MHESAAEALTHPRVKIQLPGIQRDCLASGLNMEAFPVPLGKSDSATRD
jgi:hypothetical protein